MNEYSLVYEIYRILVASSEIRRKRVLIQRYGGGIYVMLSTCYLLTIQSSQSAMQSGNKTKTPLATCLLCNRRSALTADVHRSASRDI
jgi:hypothetical protein